MIRLKRYIAFVFLLLNALVLSGQGRAFVQNYSIKEGLSQSAVTSLFIDSRGYLWVGTQEGLNRFDGHEFVVFTSKVGDTTSISYNYINSIAEDHEGNVWIATQLGLNKYDYKTGKFKRFVYSSTDSRSIGSNNVRDVFVDSNGEIYCVTNQSLDKLIHKEGHFEHYWFYNDDLRPNISNGDNLIVKDSITNSFWIGTKDGLSKFDSKYNTFKRFTSQNEGNGLTNNHINDLVFDKDAHLWIATNFGLNRLDLKDGTFRSFFPESGIINYSDQINDVFILNAYLVLATNNGILFFNRKTEKFYNQIFDLNIDFKNNVVTKIIEDKFGNYWVGTLNGLYKVVINRNTFNLYTIDKNGNHYFGNNIISSVVKLSANEILVGSWGSGLYLLDRGKRESIKIDFEGKNKASNQIVHSMYKEDDKVLIGTRNGVFIYDIRDRKAYSYFDYYGIKKSAVFANNRIYQILKYNEKHWFVTSNGIYYSDSSGIKQADFLKQELFFKENDQNYTALFIDDAHLLLGTNIGLFVYDKRDKAFIDLKEKKWFLEYGLNVKEVLCLQDIGDNYLVGTVNGLYQVSKDFQHCISYTMENGLANALIYSIETFGEQEIWVSTNLGISKINVQDQTIANFDQTNGLQGYEFNIASSYKAEDGELFFGGISGLNSFYSQNIDDDYLLSDIRITSIEIVDHNGKTTTYYHEVDKIRVKDNFRLISIQFSNLDYLNPNKVNYSYTLETNKGWINLGNRHYASFSNLKTGTHVFKVRGTINNKSTNEAHLIVEIQTPIYRTRTAIVVATLFIVILILLIPFLKINEIRKTNKFLQKQQMVMNTLEIQREELITKNKSITDSINYAKRIQEAIMPSYTMFKKIFPEAFILYYPKDIVSGDFYWVNEKKNKTFIAVVDCTGHGVPGAFMSIIGIELLRNITNVKGINDSAEVLNELNKGIKEVFSIDQENNPNVKDGMDVSFIIIDNEKKELQYSGALNTMYLLRDDKILELKGERFAVGLAEHSDNQLYKSHLVKLEKDDVIYLFTDGYADQFGGPDNKKFKYRRFRQLLLNIHKLPLEDQKLRLSRNFNNWRGKNEQVDDILIVGIKPF